MKFFLGSALILCLSAVQAAPTPAPGNSANPSNTNSPSGTTLMSQFQNSNLNTDPHANSHSPTGGWRDSLGGKSGATEAINQFSSYVNSAYNVNGVGGSAVKSDHSTRDGLESTPDRQPDSSSKSWSKMLSNGVDAVAKSGLLSKKGENGLRGLTTTAQAVSKSGGLRTLAANFVDKTLESDSAANSVKSGSTWGKVKDFFRSKTKKDGLNQVANLAVQHNLISGKSRDALIVSQGILGAANGFANTRTGSALQTGEPKPKLLSLQSITQMVPKLIELSKTVLPSFLRLSNASRLLRNQPQRQ